MSNQERETILLLSKYLFVYKNDNERFSLLRKYLNYKISNLINKRQTLKYRTSIQS